MKSAKSVLAATTDLKELKESSGLAVFVNPTLVNCATRIPPTVIDRGPLILTPIEEVMFKLKSAVLA